MSNQPQYTAGSTTRFANAVKAERASQEAKWGPQRHTWPEWMTILTEEVGEAAMAANHAHWDVPSPLLTASEVATFASRQVEALRIELIQAAAVCAAIIEHIDEQLNANGGAS